MNTDNNILFVALLKISKNAFIDKFCYDLEKKVSRNNGNINSANQK
jgi:hypothetical protein